MATVPERRGRSKHHAIRGPEGGRAGAADRLDRPHVPPLRRDRPAEAVAAHRVGAPPVHGRGPRPLAAGAVAAAARLLAGGGRRLPRPARLLAAGGAAPPRRPPAGANRATAEVVRT